MKQIKLSILVMLAISNAGSLAVALSSENSLSSSMNQDGYFIGIGGSYNSIKAELRPSGSLTAVSGFPPRGSFTATRGSFDHTDYGFAPDLQFGYFHHINCSNWLWGLKFLYQNLHINNTENDTYLHYQNALIDDTVTASIRTKVSHELIALAFVGHSFSTGFIYLGVGPSLNATQNSINNMNDQQSGYYIGKLASFPNQSTWLWGGVAQVGTSLYLNPTWFLDFNYTYSITGWHHNHNSGPYSSALNGGLNSGMISFDLSKRMTEQALTISINKIFPG